MVCDLVHLPLLWQDLFLDLFCCRYYRDYHVQLHYHTNVICHYETTPLRIISYLIPCFVTIFQIEKDEKGCILLRELTNNTNYFGGQSLSYRYRMTPGRYLLQPTTMEAGKEREFCLRKFSSVKLAAK